MNSEDKKESYINKMAEGIVVLEAGMGKKVCSSINEYNEASSLLIEAGDLFREALKLADSEVDKKEAEELIDKADSGARDIITSHSSFLIEEVKKLQADYSKLRKSHNIEKIAVFEPDDE
jgi:hypothetical protein